MKPGYTADANGREYPAAGNRKPERKAAKRLKARVQSWEAIKDKQSMGGHQMTKPGSYKK